MKLRIKMFTVIFLFVTAAAQIPASAQSDSVPPSPPTGVGASYRTWTSITLNWNSSKDNTAVKGYQVFRDGRKIVTISKTSYTNTGLIPGRAYSYYIKAYDAAGNVSEASIPIKVQTLPDLQQPSPPACLSVNAAGYTSVSLEWEPSFDNIAVKKYEVYRDGKKAVTTVNTYYMCKGLKPGVKYDFTVRAADTAGNFSPFGNCVSAATLPDMTAPSIPAGLRAEKVAETEISLRWNPSKDNVRVREYVIYCDGRKAGKSSDESHTFKKLIPGRSYTFMVASCDESGNTSAAGRPLTVAAAADVQAPSAPANFKAKSTSGSSVSLSWDASSDNVKVQGYHVYRNGIKIAETARKTYSAKNPKGPGIWIFTVRACDLAGNLSAASKTVTIISLG